jgi:signal transduction histidine kinase
MEFFSPHDGTSCSVSSPAAALLLAPLLAYLAEWTATHPVPSSDLRRAGQRIGRSLAAHPDQLAQVQAQVTDTLYTMALQADHPQVARAAVQAFLRGCAEGVHAAYAGAGSASVRPLVEAERVAITITPALLNQLAAPVLVLDGAGHIWAFNRVCAQLTGVAAASLHGHDLAQVQERYPTVRALLPSEAWHPLPATESRVGAPSYRVHHGERQIVWMRVPFRCMVSDQPLVFWIGRDETAMHQAQAAHAVARERLMAAHDVACVQIARDLHDGPLQTLYDVGLQLDAATGTSATRAQHTVQQLIADVRAWCSELRPPTLGTSGITVALRTHLRTLAERHPALTVHAQVAADCGAFSETVQTQLYRIYHAAIVNVIRHAQAQTVTVRFSWDAEQVVLEIQDDGVGLSAPLDLAQLEQTGHYGLVGIAERAAMCGGDARFLCSHGGGMTVRVVLPGHRPPEPLEGVDDDDA